MTDQEIWDSYFTAAGGIKAVAGTPPTIPGIVGRSISKLVNRLAEFWSKHKTTLAPYLTQLAIAALEALVSQAVSIEQVNPPGPV